MELKLVVHQGQELLGNCSDVIVDADVYSIGRGSDNSWVLPDPKLHISNKHCVIHRKNSEFHLTDISTNGVYLNDNNEPLGRGRSQILKHGDAIIIGEYLIKAVLKDENGDFTQDTTPTHEELHTAHSLVDLSVLTEVSTPAKKSSSQDSVLESVLETPTAAQLTSADMTSENMLDEVLKTPSSEPSLSELLRPVSPEKEFYVPPKVVPDAALNQGATGFQSSKTESLNENKQAIPENWLDLTETQEAATHLEPVDHSKDTPLMFDTVSESPLEKSEADLQEKTSEASVLASFVAEEKVRNEPTEQAEPLTFNIQERSMASRLEQQEKDHLHGSTQASKSVYSEPEQPNFFEILMQEAGLPEHLLHGKDKGDLARLMGRMLRQFAQGTIDTLATRSMVKSEFRLQQTMIRPVDNNPLKLSPSGDEALKIMLMGDSSAYLPAESSIQEGFKDIQAHQLAMMSGIQAAFMHLLQRFDPEKLTQKFESRPRYNKGILSRNKTDLWREYQDYYHDICAMMEDEFQDLFSNEFGKAYESQLRKIR